MKTDSLKLQTANCKLSTSSRIYIAGHRGLVGSALVRNLKSQGFTNLLLRNHKELDLTDQKAVQDFFAKEKPEFVFLAAAKVGGIYANNTYPAEFIHVNLAIQQNVIHEAWKAGVKRLLFLGSSCIYPRECPQPMKEEYLLTGPLESTNEPYAIAKIAGIKLCESYNRQYGTEFRSVMPTNLYGPHDNFDLQTSHVIPAIMRKIHLAKLAMEGDANAIKRDEQINGPIPSDIQEAIGYTSQSSTLSPHSSQPKVVLWGTGKAKREFLHVDDMAVACIYVINLEEEVYQQYTQPMLSHINIGTGTDVTIKELTEILVDVIGYKGEVTWNHDMPDGTPRKLLDVNRLNSLGWKAGIELEEGLKETYKWYVSKTK